MREDLEAELAEVKRTHKIDMEGVHEEMAIMKNCIMQLYNVLLPGKLPEFLQQPALQMQQAQQAQQTPPRHMSSQQRLPLHVSNSPSPSIALQLQALFCTALLLNRVQH